MKKYIALILCAGVMLTSCGEIKKDIKHTNKLSYEKKEIQTVTALKEDIVPVETLRVRQDNIKHIEYDAKSTDLEFEKLYVAVGDEVKAGDLLVSFTSSNLTKKMQDCEDRIAESKLLLEHYKRLDAIDSQSSHKRDITLLNRDIEVMELYMEEYKLEYAECQVVATEDGTITAISDELLEGYCTKIANIVTEVSGSGKYKAEAMDDYLYEIGEKYVAKLDGIEFTFVLESINRKDGGRLDLLFIPESDMSALSGKDTFLLNIEKEPIKDVVLVPISSIVTIEGHKYVYVEKENGFLKKVEVELGESHDKNVIIKSGLVGGEKVKK